MGAIFTLASGKMTFSTAREDASTKMEKFITAVGIPGKGMEPEFLFLTTIPLLLDMKEIILMT
jgi:hypothetical protein